MIELTSRPEPRPNELRMPVPEIFATPAPVLPDEDVLPVAVLEEPVIALESAVAEVPMLEMLLMRGLAKSSCRMRQPRRVPSSCW
jgi:hypothetical protein